MLKHTLFICGDVELRIGVETQTSNMRRVNATRNNVLDQRDADGEHQPPATDQSTSPSVWASHPDDARGHTRHNRLLRNSAIPTPPRTPCVYAHVLRLHVPALEHGTALANSNMPFNARLIWSSSKTSQFHTPADEFANTGEDVLGARPNISWYGVLPYRGRNAVLSARCTAGNTTHSETVDAALKG